jgi:hypothetical protein
VQAWMHLLESSNVFHFWELICRSPEAFINIMTILGIVAYVQHGLESWRHVISFTKLTAVICKLAHSQICMYIEDAFSSVMEHSM